MTWERGRCRARVRAGDMRADYICGWTVDRAQWTGPEPPWRISATCELRVCVREPPCPLSTVPCPPANKLTNVPNDDSSRELFLIDGNSLAYRAFYALPETIATSKGFPTNAIFGFASMLVKILTEYGP